MNRVVIGLGSNIKPERSMQTCLQELRQHFGIIRESECLRTEAIGPPQPDYLNCVVLIETEKTREELKATLRHFEERLGRIRSSNKFAPRTIDLDILVWNGRVVDSDVANREFLQRLIGQVFSDPLDG